MYDETRLEEILNKTISMIRSSKEFQIYIRRVHRNQLRNRRNGYMAPIRVETYNDNRIGSRYGTKIREMRQHEIEAVLSR